MERDKGSPILQCIESQHCEELGDWIRACMDGEINMSLNSKMFVAHLAVIFLATLLSMQRCQTRSEGLNRDRAKI